MYVYIAPHQKQDRNVPTQKMRSKLNYAKLGKGSRSTKASRVRTVLNNSLSAHDSIDLIYSSHVTHSTKLA